MMIFFRLFFLVLFCLSVGKCLYFLRDGFSPRRLVVSHFSCGKDFGYAAGNGDKVVLSQPFRYLGRGRQCFAFLSEDNRYVLKFPRTDIRRISLWTYIPLFCSYRQQLISKRTKRWKQVLESFQIASEELKSQTGVVALCSPDQNSSRETRFHLIDALGCSHYVPMAMTCFIAQHKQSSWTDAFLYALDQGKRKEAERILGALVQVVVERGQKGILNRDRSFLRNYGFDGEQVYQIDIGSFFYAEGMDPKIAFEKSVRDSMDPIQQWLSQIDMQMLTFLNKKIESYLLI